MTDEQEKFHKKMEAKLKKESDEKFREKIRKFVTEGKNTNKSDKGKNSERER